MNVLNSFNLSGQRALITGSSAGIGLALAEALAQAGAHVVLNGRTASKVDAAAQSLKAQGLSVSTSVFDVTDADSNGLITYLAGESATKQVTIEVSGIADTNFLRVKFVDPATDMLLTNLTFTDPGTVPTADILSGNFFMTNYTETGTHDGAVEFSASFSSSGAWAVA